MFRRIRLNPFANQFGPTGGGPAPQGLPPAAPGTPAQSGPPGAPAQPFIPGFQPGQPNGPAPGYQGPGQVQLHPFALGQAPAPQTFAPSPYQSPTVAPGQALQAPGYTAPVPPPAQPFTPGQAPAFAPNPPAAPGQPGQPPVPQGFTPGQPSAPGQPGQPGSVVLSFQEVQDLVASRLQLQQIQQASAAQLQQAEAQRLAAMARAGNAEGAITELRNTLTAELQRTQQEAAQAALDAAVARSMSGLTFRDQAAYGMAEEIFRNRVEVARDPSGRVVVREKGTGRSVQEAAQSWFTTQGAIFLAPSVTPPPPNLQPGGWAPNPNPPQPQVLTEGEKAYQSWLQQVQQAANQGMFVPGFQVLGQQPPQG